MNAIPTIRFDGTLRPSQADVVKIVQAQLEDEQRRLHIVAPPGSGKTVVGLYLWAEIIRRPAVVLSPTSAIQMQWAARTDLFRMEDGSAVETFVSTDPKNPQLLTSLTYQSVTLPQRGNVQTESAARERWIGDLIKKEEVADFTEANLWIDDLEKNNPSYYSERLGIYRKQARDAKAKGGDSLETLHRSSLETLALLKAKNVGLVILDECHHLLSHWGRVLADVDEYLDGPILVGLTATPPDVEGRQTADVRRYIDFLGPIDYEVPVPAVVKDGFLAPYQDLVYFVYPTREEMEWLEGVWQAMNTMVWQLNEPLPAVVEADVGEASERPPAPVPPLAEWLQETLRELRLGTITCENWEEFESRFEVFSYQARRLLQFMQVPIPPNVPQEQLLDEFEMGMRDEKKLPVGLGGGALELLVPVLERYIRQGLRRSGAPGDHDRAEKATGMLRTFGVQVTMDRTQACASPVTRVVAYSKSKCAALVPILSRELEVLGELIRAVVITDYETTSAVAADIEHLLDEETGGAVAAFRTILSDPKTDQLDPILVTGSTVLVDDDLCPRFLDAARTWLREANVEVQLETDRRGEFFLIKGKGTQWGTRVYVQMVTELFQRGLTRCLVGTRGLLGEGWDASRTNTLVDLTTATTTMTVNQLRGRSIRIDSAWPDKVADNWDVVCLASGEKGSGDFERFGLKHQATYGVCEDGAIEKGVGHVHPSASLGLKMFERDPSLLNVINSEMLSRAGQRDATRKLWGVGEPYEATPTEVTELQFRKNAKKICGFPPYSHKGREPLTLADVVGKMARAILLSLAELKIVPVLGNARIDVGERHGDFLRVMLADNNEVSARVFNDAVRELLSPLDDARYVIPRYMDEEMETFWSEFLPAILARYFVRYQRQLAMWHAVPKVFAQNKTRVAVFQKHWNRHVSPGDAVFVQRGEGKELLENVRAAGLEPDASVSKKEVFVKV